MEQNAALERELRDARQSLSGAGPTAAPSTSVASVEDPVVVVPTPTGPAACHLSLRLAACAISLLSNESDICGRQVYPRVKDTPPPSRSHYQSLEDSLRFQVEEDLELGDPSQGVQGLSLHDARSGLLVEVPRGEDCKGEVDEGRGEEPLDYGSSPEWEAPDGGPICSQLRSKVHVVQHDGTSSDEVFFLILYLLWFFSCLLISSHVLVYFHHL